MFATTAVPTLAELEAEDLDAQLARRTAGRFYGFCRRFELDPKSPLSYAAFEDAQG